MGFRQVYIKEAEKLSLQAECLVVKKSCDKTVSFPLEDIDLVFVEDPNCVITARLLSSLSKFGVSIIFCGPDYLPSSITAPINGHYLQSSLLRLQLDLLPSKKNKFWEMVIRRKIENQMCVLEKTVNDLDSYARLKECLSMVKFGDEKNMEGMAAKIYFRALFGDDFIRFGESSISSALNYGYSILTGAVIRSVAFSGLNDNLGIWHHSSKNANNLSCDLVEPFRPIVDYFVFNHLLSLTIPLSMDIRKGLLGLLNSPVYMSNKQYQVSYAIQLFVNGFIDYLKNGDIQRISLPVISLSSDKPDTDE